MLRTAAITVQGRITTASNTTLYCELDLDGETLAAVYKPIAGERPLWDFPTGTLAGREVAAYVVSVATGWDVVPPTVLRDGPLGPGMCQLWVDVDPDVELVDLVPTGTRQAGWRRVLDATGVDGSPVSLVHADHPLLRRMAVLDGVLNNADRKGGHVLVGRDGSVHGVDHGVCFHVEDKLRTVLWGWAGQPVPDEAVPVLDRLATDLTPGTDTALRTRLLELISPAEVDATHARTVRLLQRRRHPRPGQGWPPTCSPVPTPRCGPAWPT